MIREPRANHSLFLGSMLTGMGLYVPSQGPLVQWLIDHPVLPGFFLGLPSFFLTWAVVVLGLSGASLWRFSTALRCLVSISSQSDQPGHMAIAVEGADSFPLGLHFFPYQQKLYFCCAAEGWGPGEVPHRYRGIFPEVYVVRSTAWQHR